VNSKNGKVDCWEKLRIRVCDLKSIAREATISGSQFINMISIDLKNISVEEREKLKDIVEPGTYHL